MSYHIVSIDNPQCSLNCRDGQLICRSDDGGERRLPMEDIASIIITSFSATIHSQLLLEAARFGVSLVICKSHKPTSLLLPANRSTDTILTRAQVELPKRLRALLWKKTVDAKCHNQLVLALHMAPNDPGLSKLSSVAEGKSQSKESTAARLFWGVFGRAVDYPAFRRNRKEEGLNSLLNYGYAVLLNSILQKIFGLGLDPTFGVGHSTRERSTPLAYDLMEPFRPCVDWRVFQWVTQRPNPEKWVVDKEFRGWVTSFTLDIVAYMDLKLEVQGCIEGSIRTFRKAIMEQRATLYKPWTLKNLKWAG
ncbi:type II CRISPR-associated endonuclease Cas1 [Verrucomicrobia bacterium]|nr:type II CRISPR-associated endonuclease Cas1 [Verrucomicrobiota bacterium]